MPLVGGQSRTTRREATQSRENMQTPHAEASTDEGPFRCEARVLTPAPLCQPLIYNINIFFSFWLAAAEQVRGLWKESLSKPAYYTDKSNRSVGALWRSRWNDECELKLLTTSNVCRLFPWLVSKLSLGSLLNHPAVMRNTQPWPPHESS